MDNAARFVISVTVRIFKQTTKKKVDKVFTHNVLGLCVQAPVDYWQDRKREGALQSKITT